MIRKMMLLAALMLGVVGAQAPSHAAPIEVGTDEANDWGREFDPEAYPIGDALGQELVSAAIDADGQGTVTFVIGLKSLPGGGTPEASRYVWALDVNGEYAELDGKFSNYSRGACDPTAGSCPPARDPGPAPFLVRGDCDTSGQVVTCRELGKIQATFDESSATISIPVPVSLLTDSDCADIGPGLNTSFSAALTAIPSAFFSQSLMPHDTMELSETPVTAC